MKKLISILITVMMVVSFISGCGTSKSTDTGSTNTESAQKQETTEQASTEKSSLITDVPVELSIAICEVPVAGVSYADKLPVFQELEKRTGVTIKFDVLNSSDYVKVMKTRIAAATDLPDIYKLMSGGSESLDIMPLIKGNLILQLDDYIEKEAPNIKALYKESPDLKSTMISPDGKMYSIPNRVNALVAYERNPLTFLIRNDWLQKVGVNTNPETIDEWYNVLKLFKTADPNGNNKDDEIPYSGQFYMISAFAEAYGINYHTSFYQDDSGVVQYDWMKPSAKEYLQTMNKWYVEKLIDPQYLTITTDNMWGQMLDDMVGATFLSSASNCDWLNTNNKKNQNADWRAVIPPKQISGEDGFTVRNDRSGGKTVISSSCKNPDIAVKWIDYLFSDEGSILTTFGIEGVHYTVQDGKYAYTEAILKDGKRYENTKSVGIDPSGVPQLIRPEYYDMPSAYSQEIRDSVKPVGKHIITPFPEFISSDSEAEVLSKKLADINTYADEMLNKFIIGSEPISNFDKFVQKLKELGIDEVLKVKQAQYDRSLGK